MLSLLLSLALSTSAYAQSPGTGSDAVIDLHTGQTKTLKHWEESKTLPTKEGNGGNSEEDKMIQLYQFSGLKLPECVLSIRSQNVSPEFATEVMKFVNSGVSTYLKLFPKISHSSFAKLV